MNRTTFSPLWGVKRDASSDLVLIAPCGWKVFVHVTVSLDEISPAIYIDVKKLPALENLAVQYCVEITSCITRFRSIRDPSVECHVPSSHNVAATLKIAKRSKPRQTHQNSAGYCSQRKLTSEFVGVMEYPGVLSSWVSPTGDTQWPLWLCWVGTPGQVNTCKAKLSKAEKLS
uniref:Uncharacterized protein n=1 Tax=Physcomitrium patens TaxID=3218 RepID=A0A2K1L6F0_PHYPA|nr:hypothetical protein PHYPA_000015 [Physcomitrium patens]